eukprot:Transcript_23345.p2 GENE.Transcript_23345~~Transcript_23345.p2  ORF type:complete len:286 (+),score=63.22 Transcript_23345:761-1618(+)
MLRAMNRSSIICMKDVGLANAGIVYARPGSAAALRLLYDVAWRVQLFQNHPEVVNHMFPWSKEPPYANSDDQTLLNDAITSAVTRNRTFLGSTARFEAKNKYGHKDQPEWGSLPESREWSGLTKRLWRRARTASVHPPWIQDPGVRVGYRLLPISDDDAVALAPRFLFAHLPYTVNAAITHLTAARGFKAKVASLTRMGRWNPWGSMEDANASSVQVLAVPAPDPRVNAKGLGAKGGGGGKGRGRGGLSEMLGGRGRGGRGRLTQSRHPLKANGGRGRGRAAASA